MFYNLDIVKMLFEEFSCGILPDSGEYYVIVPKINGEFIPTIKDINYDTITFYVNKYGGCEILFIHSINNKMGISGKETLNKIEQFCNLRMPKIKTISLEDDSFVMWKGYRINLTCLNILKKGLSYYNEQGYLQETFTEDVAHWNALKNKKVIETFKDEKIENFKLDQKLKEGNFICFDHNKELSINEILYLLKDVLINEDTFSSVGNFLYDIIRNDKDEDPIIVTNLLTLCCIKIKNSMCDEVIKNI